MTAWRKSKRKTYEGVKRETKLNSFESKRLKTYVY